MRELLSGNYAIAEAVKMTKAQLIPAYPITPQTPIYERLSEMESRGELPGTMVRVESEHSAMAMCISASLGGVRVFTATSSQGIALMHEMLHFASGNRVPVVMGCVNRVLAAPWSFGSDQTDTLSQRDTGWMQFYCEDNQEAFDTVIQAYRISEATLLPSMVIIDAFFNSHFIEPMEVPDQADIDLFLPSPALPERFDLDNPAFVSNVVTAGTQFFPFRQAAFQDMENARGVIREVDEEYKAQFGRGYGMVEAVRTDDAELVLVTSGSMTSTARVALDGLRAKGYNVGLLKIKVFRPFPKIEIRNILQNVKKVVVIDRNISLGKEGIFCQELKSAIVNSKAMPQVYGYIAGLDGVDVSPEIIEGICMDVSNKETPDDLPVWVRG
ncbi:MAG: Pyruvate synthase subunit PorA [Syntrophorhabdaceae bacterium PtaU1.Bin034]|jgi:pyruvate/2-oxoacid:ferredoxin oxidoreductase alpha subunit|nr:MAG: Pyruvate synthase subunit PorA [Syntrophorhabdaceae bacterium PtaU1.Bin034]